MAVLTLSAIFGLPLCPSAKDLPQLTLQQGRGSVVPLLDDWQIFLGDVPMSDDQLARLAQNDRLIARMETGMRRRGAMVYLGLGGGAVGAIASSVGWTLHGQANLPKSATLSLAAGGALISTAGILFAMSWIQSSVEPFVAPTPQHRLTREEARSLVAQVNTAWYRRICRAAGGT